jgi:hypothetical protein
MKTLNVTRKLTRLTLVVLLAATLARPASAGDGTNRRELAELDRLTRAQAAPSLRVLWDALEWLSRAMAASVPAGASSTEEETDGRGHLDPNG